MKARRRISRQWILPWAVIAGTSLPFLSGGCIGGSTSEGGNPDLTLEFRMGGDRIEASGFLEFHAAGSNPEFFALPPDDGATPPNVIIVFEPDETPIPLFGEKSLTIRGDYLRKLAASQPFLPLLKGSVSSAARTSPPRSLDFTAALYGDSLVGWIAGIRVDSSGYRASGVSNDTLVFQVSRARSYSGTVDTSTEAGRAIALFVPGTPFYAQVRGNGFEFQGVPEGSLPLRWVSADGWIHAMEDSLGADWTEPLKPGERLDSIRVPTPPATLTAPVADPPGQFAFTDSVRVSLEAESGARIYYSLDGTPPGPGSKVYTGPILLRSSVTLQAVAYRKGVNRSPTSVNNYMLVPAAPAASPVGIAFRDSLAVTLTAPTKDASIRYTLDGSDPGSAGALSYAAPIILRVTTTLKALAMVPGLGRSHAIEERYFLMSDSAAAPE